MADTYEKDLAQKSTLTTSDYIRVVGSDNVSYKQLVSSVMGLANDRAIALPPSDDFDSVTKTSGNISVYRWTSATLNSPYKGSVGASDTGFVISYFSGANYGLQVGFSSNRDEIYTRRLSGGAYASWIKMPTRAEVDALITTTAFSGTSSSSGNLQITAPSTSYRPTLAYSTASDSLPTWFEIAYFSGNWYVRAYNSNGVLTSTALSGTVVWAKIS